MDSKKIKRVFALIPARGGSKSIPKKNIFEIGGHPLIAYSIASALQAKSIDKVIVSTDDPEIARIAENYGAEVPFLRPHEISQDDTPDFPVFEHALNWLESNERYIPDIIVHLRPTSPLRPKGLIDRAVRIFIENPGIDCVRGVVESEENPFKMWLIDKNGFMKPLMEGWFREPYNMPRQKLPKTYWQTGHIDVIGINAIKEKRSLTGTRILPIFIEREYCIDIDKIEHLYEIEKIISSKRLNIDLPDEIISRLHKHIEK
jgi:N-acylneuraminate cytidylyltransferase